MGISQTLSERTNMHDELKSYKESQWTEWLHTANNGSKETALETNNMLIFRGTS